MDTANNYACGAYGSSTYNGCDETIATPTPTATATPRASTSSGNNTSTSTPTISPEVSATPSISPEATPSSSPAYTVAPGSNQTPTSSNHSSTFGVLGWVGVGLVLLALIIGIGIWLAYRRRNQQPPTPPTTPTPPSDLIMPNQGS